MGKGTKLQQRIGTKQQSPHDNSPFSCFEYLILYKLYECIVHHIYEAGYMEGLPLHNHLYILLQLFLQPQWTSSLQMTAAAS